jgi:hypothetical protein
MARLVLIGDVAEVELTVDDEDGQVIATCVKHPSDAPWRVTSACGWTERYDDMRDATEYAADHADGTRQE